MTNIHPNTPASSTLVVIVPAHNEEGLLSKTLQSLQACVPPPNVVVVADNCTDQTANIARKNHVSVIERHDTTKIGKPYALEFAFQTLKEENFLYYAIIDADTQVEPNFTQALFHAFENRADVVQTRYENSSSNLSIKQRLLDIAFFAANTLKPLGRQYWGLSCGILGNGFAFKKEVIGAVPFECQSIVEDLAYHLRLVENGYRVHFITTTTVKAVVPSDESSARVQRSRWEGGRLSLAATKGSTLLTNFFQGKTALFEPLLDLFSLPLALQLLSIALLLLSPFPVMNIYAWIALGAIVAYVVSAISFRQQGWKDWAAICLAPFYLLWKVFMIPSILKSAIQGKWNRTGRSKGDN